MFIQPHRCFNTDDLTVICPVCKSSTYLNPNMIFKVNPECYHKMCDSCVERIFTSGPAPCPVAGCGKTLRKNRFKIPRFEDLAVERECDIRARVAQILNHSEADFDSLRTYNDYEEWKEELIMDLVSGNNVQEWERKLKEHAKENQESIKANARHEEDLREQVKEDERVRIERSELSRAEAQREFQEELAEREAGRKEVINKILNTNSDVLRVAKEAESVLQKRAAARNQPSTANGTMGVTSGSGDANITGKTTGSVGAAKSTGFSISGLKKIQPQTKEVEKVYDAFDGLSLQFKYYSLAEKYFHPRSNAVDKEKGHASGGYLGWDYQRRAQMDAHAGLGIFVEEEKA